MDSRTMKKVFITIPGFLISFLSLSSLAFADTTIGNTCAGGTFGNLCSLNASNVGHIIGTVVNILFLVAALLALIYLVLGGLKWVTSEGDTKNVEAARNQIIAAAVGLGVTFLSYIVINLLVHFFLGVNSISDINLPTL